jgi:hypothetical protein
MGRLANTGIISESFAMVNHQRFNNEFGKEREYPFHGWTIAQKAGRVTPVVVLALHTSRYSLPGF